jgi:hypothetical protein
LYIFIASIAQRIFVTKNPFIETKITASLMPLKIYKNQMVLFLLVAMLLRYRLYDCLFKQA